MERELIEQMRSLFGPPPRRLTKGQIGGLCLSPPQGWDLNSDRGIMFRGQEAICVGGMATLAWSLKAYYPIYAPGDSDCLGMVLFSDCTDIEQLLTEAPLVVDRLGKLRGTTEPGWNEEERRFMAAYDDDYKGCDGLAVPKRFSPVLQCYITDFYFHRSWLPEGCLRPGALPVLATVSPRPQAIPVPLRYWTEAFAKDWSVQVRSELTAYAQSIGRARLTARVRTLYLAAPAVKPDAEVPKEALIGSWIHEDEVETFDRAPDLHSMHIWNRWTFEKNGTAKMRMEAWPMVNGEPGKKMLPTIESYEGRYAVENGVVRVEFAGHARQPATLMIVGPNELAISQTERLHGPFDGHVGIGDGFGHFSTSGAATIAKERSESPVDAFSSSEEWIEIVFHQKEVPPGFGYAFGAALMPQLVDQGLGRVLTSANSAGSRSVIVRTSAEQKAAAVALTKRVLAEHDAPKGTKVIGQDGEVLAVVEPSPPPLPKSKPPVDSKLAWTSFLLGCGALLTGWQPILAPLIIAALVLSFMALKRIRMSNGLLKGRRLAQWGMLLAVGGTLWFTVRIVRSAASAIAELRQASEQLANEPGYAAAHAAEQATRWPEEGALANTDKARIVAADIGTALVALQRQMLSGSNSSLVLYDRAPAVCVHALPSKVAVTLSFRMGSVNWRGGAEKAFYEAAWTMVHQVVSHASLVPVGSDFALGIHSFGNYQAMFFGHTAAPLKPGDPVSLPPHERETHQGLLLNNQKRFYKYFIEEAAKDGVQI